MLEKNLNNGKKICILMTTYNPSNYLYEQLDSIFEQEGVELEVIIRDDASTQKDILRDVQHKYPITLLEGKKNLGVAGNIKELLLYVAENKREYDLFAYSDQDDVWLREKMKKAISAHENLNPEKPGVYYSNLQVVDEFLTPTHKLFKKGIVKNSFGQSLAQVFLFACTSVFNKIMLDELIKYNFSDLGFDSLLYYLGILNENIIYDDTPYIFYRQHGQNVSGQKEQGLKYIKNKLIHFFYQSERAVMKNKAQYIVENLSPYLSEKNYLLAHQVSAYSGLLSRLALIGNSDIQAGYYPKDIYRWLRLLLGRY
ncbi:glycosyltransferase%2C group 2 family protein [Streptococcus suis]|uniref:Glycosyltransferase, group 2 family protein n=1 Tax=Streptococcus suis TaxID=1307 RepID=A0A123SYE3_STRSU|nr:glycosyltransferase [Streptococcus suis]CYU69377.1 glycosyltransferase%2C group 2 family protein [Streptococcus suis]